MKLVIGWDSNQKTDADGNPVWKDGEVGEFITWESNGLDANGVKLPDTSYGRGCGYSPETLEYPNLYFPKLPDASAFTSLLSVIPDVSNLNAEDGATALAEQ